MALAIADSPELSGKKTEAAGSLPPPPNNGDKKKENCLRFGLRGAPPAQDAGRTNRYEKADDREEGAHFRNRGEPADQSSLFETTLAGVTVSPALIQIDIIAPLSVAEGRNRNVDIDVAATAAGVLIIIHYLVVAE